MALVLAMLAVLLARSEEVVLDLQLAEAPTISPAGPPPFSAQRYRSGMDLATAGVVLVPVGVGMVVGGYVLAVTAQSQTESTVGASLFVVGGLAGAVGPPLAIIGSLKSARALRRAGVHISTTWGTASIVLLVGSIVFPPAYFGSVLTAGAQMAMNTIALHQAGLASTKWVAIVPRTADDTPGLALVGSF